MNASALLPNDVFSPTTEQLAFAEQVFEQLNKHWQEEGSKLGIGMDRLGYSNDESEAHKIISDEARKMGAEIYVDLAGNRYAVFKGQDRFKPVIMMGSHLDAVPRGGKYDGPAGVVGALQAVKIAQQNNLEFPQDVVIAMWRHEESPTHNQFVVGSKAATGLLDPKVLNNLNMRDVRPLHVHMAEQGVNVEQLRQMLETRTPLLPIENILLSSEIHIEQYTELMDEGYQLSFINTIAGNRRFPPAQFTGGKGGHTGAVKRKGKKYPLLAAADFAVKLFKKLEAMQRQRGLHFVDTATDIEVPNAGRTNVPTQASVPVDMRALDDETLDMAAQIYVETANEVAKEWDVDVDVGADKMVAQAAQPLSAKLALWFQTTARELGIRSNIGASGAGHDTSNLAAFGIECVMTFIAHNGISHDWRELLTNLQNETAFEAGSNFAAALAPHVKLITTRDTPIPTRPTTQTFAQAMMDRGALKLEAA